VLTVPINLALAARNFRPGGETKRSSDRFLFMTVQSLRSRGDMSIRRRRDGRSRRAVARAGVQAQASPATRDPRDSGPSQDHALYSCRCGFVFEALVLTSVDCPHCGGAQAW
jgi:hypothetical protein